MNQLTTNFKLDPHLLPSYADDDMAQTSRRALTLRLSTTCSVHPHISVKFLLTILARVTEPMLEGNFENDLCWLIILILK
jgi:hypothetical protein